MSDLVALGTPAQRDLPDEAKFTEGLICSFNRASAHTQEVHRANASPLAQLLVERGVLDRSSLEQRRDAIGESLRQEYLRRGMAVMLQETEVSKYQVAEAPKIDCASRLSLCKGACCKLSFALTAEDVEEGVVRWNLRRPYVVAQGSDGHCVHQERGTCRCSIYERRPGTCRTYDCRRDRRIWLDFEQRIPNPRVEDPDWPLAASREPDTAPPSAAGQPEASDAPAIDGSGPWQPLTVVFDEGSQGRPIAARARAAANRLFDRLVRARVTVLGRSTSSFHVWGCLGLVAAILLGVLLIAIQDLSFWVLAVVTATGCLTFLALAMGTKIVTGEEALIYYHHEIGILLAAGVVLQLLGQPVLPYLEPTLLAVGMFLAWGRVGCLMVGCCHGRPHAWGARYGPEHAADGFASHLTGVRLFPIQLLEAITVLGAVIWGALLVVLGRPPGEALALYVMGYGAARFVFEFARGDMGRPYLAGFSEAQWTSLVLMALALGAGLQGSLPLHAWHVMSVALVLTCALAVACRRRLASVPTHEILRPQHLDEIARVLRASRLFAETASDRAPPNDDSDGVLIGTTSQGFRLSAGASEDGRGAVSHYGLSRRGDSLSTPAARVLGRLILRLEHPGDSGQLVSRTPGLFHLLVRPGDGKQTRRT